jgi:hypothetical protein
MADMQYHIGKPDTGEERTWEEVEQTLPPHVLAVMGLTPPTENGAGPVVAESAGA